jgi:hypothetical protein
MLKGKKVLLFYNAGGSFAKTTLRQSLIPSNRCTANISSMILFRALLRWTLIAPLIIPRVSFAAFLLLVEYGSVSSRGDCYETVSGSLLRISEPHYHYQRQCLLDCSLLC